MNIIAIDPGIMTGYCLAHLEYERLKYFPFQRVDDVDELWQRLKDFRPEAVIIEDFQFRRNKETTGLELFPVQLIGVSKLYSLICGYPCALYIQSAAQAKGYYTAPMLKQLGLYKPGAKYEHAMDASRHLLQWCMFGPGNKYIGKQSTEEFATMLDEWPPS